MDTILNTLIDFCLLLFVCLPVIFVISDYIKDRRLDKFAAQWFGDEENIKLYNRFIKYLTTNLETGLYHPTKYQIPKIHSASEFFELEGNERVIARATVESIQALSKIKDGLKNLKEEIDEYLDQAEKNRQLKGF